MYSMRPVFCTYLKDTLNDLRHNSNMQRKGRQSRHRSAAQAALRRAASSSDGLIRAADLAGTSPQAVSRALARLAKKGALQRVAKGIYYAPKETLLGMSRPSEAAITAKALEGKSRPTGTTAANLLGLSTQVSARPEYAAFGSSSAKALGGARLTLRRGAMPSSLEAWQGALLEVARDGGRFVEVEPEIAISRLATLLSEQGTARSRRQLAKSAQDEPPRVRAILGALLSHLGSPESVWAPLKASLNPLSRFEFGIFRALPNSREWQAK